MTEHTIQPLLCRDLPGGGTQQGGLARARSAHEGDHLPRRESYRDVFENRDVTIAQRHVTEFYERLVELDRKSTRLNSSHVAISYAVFCLKKKKNPRTYFQ